MKKILTVVGARPQFVKAAAVSRAIRKSDQIEEVILHTGQHYDINMSDVFFDEMNIPKPNHFLDINALGHGAMTGRMLEEIEKVLIEEKPNVVMVYGDTNSTLAGALAAKKIHVPVAHVEAGLRSFNMKMPEEINRILTDRISDILFCPTKTAVENLNNEGYSEIKDSKVCLVGDVMYDAALFYANKPKNESLIEKLGLKNTEFVLCTCHRQENTDNRECLKGIVDSLNEINQKYPVVLPLHPRTQKMLSSFNLDLNCKRINPVGYFEMLELLQNCKFVMTDSGGLQKEAYFFKKPCITMREQTEWVELVEVGCNFLTGANKDLILEKVMSVDKTQFDFSECLYGNGKTSELIVEELQRL
jgi:UDP-GlcNAc3NAcA epimerase